VATDPAPAAQRGVPSPEPTAEPVRAPSPLPGRRGASGGVRLVSDSPSDPTPAAPPAEDRGLRRIAAVGTADPITELREALGFGPLDRVTLAPRPSWSGLLRQQGVRDSSPQAALDAAIAWQTEFSARGTAEGAYLQRVSERIEARWDHGDLDLQSRAMGVQGEVTLRYEIRRDGRVQRIQLVRSSGNAALDRMARAAIPERVERFPPELHGAALHHQVTFRYRNPMVGP
jgi:TonB family protein